MGKASSMDAMSPGAKLKKRKKSMRNKYLKPGALAQLRYNRATGRCTDIGKKRILILDSEKIDCNIRKGKSVSNPDLLTPERPSCSLGSSGRKVWTLSGSPMTPKTPQYKTDSRLESLPLDILVKIMCHLHHDELKAVFHVSQRIRNAVLLAKQYYFNYTTPDRSRQEMLMMKTPLSTEQWPFASKGDMGDNWWSRPQTPKAPRHGPRPPSRLNNTEMSQVAAVLFQESAYSMKSIMPPGLPRSHCKTLSSTRVLFYEDELCQAVAQNKLH